jgi:phenylacetate-CoA ligase
MSLIRLLAKASMKDGCYRSLQDILKKTARLSAEQLAADQLVQIQSVIASASETIPWYKEKFGKLYPEDINHDTIQNLPILSRAEVREHGDSLLLPEPRPRGYRIVGENSTSGSTGAPLKTIISYSRTLIFEAILDRFHTWGGRNKDNSIAYITALFEQPLEILDNHWNGAKGKVFKFSLAAPLEKQLDWLVRKNPHYLATYPSNAKALLELTKKIGAVIPNLCDVIMSSERIPEGLEKECREIWGASLTRTYSANEIGGIALGHKKFSGYLVQSENVYVEIVNDDGKPCDEGETGRILITTLQDGLRPLIRYEVGDYGKFGKFHEGIGYPVISELTGRERNMLTLPNGDKVWPFFSVDAMIKLNIKQWQLIQTSTTHIKARLVADKLTPAQEADYRNIVNEFLPTRFNVSIEYVQSINRTESRKFEDFINCVE